MRWYVQCFGKWQGGLGDFFRSWFCTFVYARRLKLNYPSPNNHDATVQPYIPDHPLKFCLHAIDKIDDDIETLTITTHHYNEQEMCDILDRLWAKKQSAVLISNIRFLECHVLADYRDEFRAEIRQTTDLKSRIAKLREDAKLENDFYCIHLRCGDCFMTHSNGKGEVVGHCDTAVMGTNVNEIFPAAEAAIEFLKNHHRRGRRGQSLKTQILLITDNSKLKQVLVEKYKDNLVALPTNIVHLAVPDKMGDDQELIRESTLDTAAEFFLLGQSMANVMLAYSGFVIWPSFIYEVPLYQWHTLSESVQTVDTPREVVGEIRQFDWIFPY